MILNFTLMKAGFSNVFLVALMAVAFSLGCKKNSGSAPQLSVSSSTINFQAQGADSSITITCNSAWSVTNPVSSWLQISPTTGTSGTATAKLTSSPNTTGVTRSGIVEVSADNGQVRRIIVSQVSSIYPSYNTLPLAPDSTGMTSTAIQLAAKIGLGWNIGNTMEAVGGETAWGNPAITEDYIKFVKQSGFNAIRLPCSWNQYSDAKTAKIQDSWLARVKQVVQYCVNNDMYVMVNIHWDGGWLENHCTPDKKNSVNAKQKAFWEQIATALRDFDEHVLFASANEPNAYDATNMSVLLSYHQTFVDAVRSTGGRNHYRVLVVQGSSDLMNTFPVDPMAGRMMYEEHNYTPSQFCFLSEDASWGKMFYYWGAGHHSTIEPDRNATWGEESVQLDYFQRMKAKFVDKGIPFIMGEYGAYRRTTPKDLATHNDAVDYWITYVTHQAIMHGLKPFWWDTGGALDRRADTVIDARTINAIHAGAN